MVIAALMAIEGIAVFFVAKVFILPEPAAAVAAGTRGVDHRRQAFLQQSASVEVQNQYMDKHGEARGLPCVPGRLESGVRSRELSMKGLHMEARRDATS